MSLDAFLGWLNTLDPIWVHLVLFVMLLVEGIGTPGLPFELVWLVEGALIHQGRTTLAEAIAWGAVGNWIGNLVGYMLGERGVRFLPPRARTMMGVDEVRRWLHRWGGPVVIFSRWFGLIRTPFILYAGAAGMPFWKYALYSAFGALSWVAVWQIGLYLFGELFLTLWHDYQWYVVGAGVLIAAVSVTLALRGRRGTAKEDSESSGDAPGGTPSN